MTIKLKKHDKKNEKHDKKLKNTLISWWENTKNNQKLGNTNRSKKLQNGKKKSSTNTKMIIAQNRL